MESEKRSIKSIICKVLLPIVCSSVRGGNYLLPNTGFLEKKTAVLVAHENAVRTAAVKGRQGKKNVEVSAHQDLRFHERRVMK